MATSILYCAIVLSIATVLLFVATAFTVHNYRMLRKMTVRREAPVAGAAVAAPVKTRRTGMPSYDDIGETEFTGAVEPYTPAVSGNRPSR